MYSKEYRYLIFVSIAALSVAVVASEKSGSANSTVLKESPIIIETPSQQYDQPTLNEYNQCHDNRDQCLRVCSTNYDVASCENKCPLCPNLIAHELLVQGINDTEYRGEPIVPLNTTNIIRLTNEIHNRIDNNMGDITAHNNNNIQVHQNISTTGGKYGLGYNNKGPCCMVMHSTNECNRRQRSVTGGCPLRKHRVCGSRCTSRVMRVKRVTHCNDMNDDCRQQLEYIPYKPIRPSGGCRSTSQWPYVSCPSRPTPMINPCSRCYSMPYVYVMRNGLPSYCSQCFGPVAGSYPGQYMPSPWYYPNMGNGIGYDYDTDFSIDNVPNGWKIDTVKCRGPDGRITEDCGNGVTDNPSDIDPLGNLPEAQDYDDIHDWYEDELAVNEDPEYQRPKMFKRSAYSKRNENN